jgi:hypothetical protein
MQIFDIFIGNTFPFITTLQYKYSLPKWIFRFEHQVTKSVYYRYYDSSSGDNAGRYEVHQISPNELVQLPNVHFEQWELGMYTYEIRDCFNNNWNNTTEANRLEVGILLIKDSSTQTFTANNTDNVYVVYGEQVTTL